jgi:hypothetical protein
MIFAGIGINRVRIFLVDVNPVLFRPPSPAMMKLPAATGTISSSNFQSLTECYC